MIGTGMVELFDRVQQIPRRGVSWRLALIALSTVVALGLVVAAVVRAGDDGVPAPNAGSPSHVPLNDQPVQLAPVEAFARTWQRTDQPVAETRVDRTWIWGPAPITGELLEDYAESPGGQRAVVYYDKSRMELTQPAGDPTSPWYVTNGLLVVELMSGSMQVGDNAFERRAPAAITVAGDPDDPNSPTYAVLSQLRDGAALPDGATITQRVDGDGAVSDDPALARYGVTAAEHVQVAGIDHQVASPFWAFMRSRGLIVEDGVYIEGALFENPFYATGYPLTEAYWTTVRVGGTPRDVLLQCFERRCLTYTPDNPAGWQVEAGNVGQHYERWRYASGGPPPSPTPTATATTTATPSASETPSTPPTGQLVTIGDGSVDAWMRSIVRDSSDRVWVVAMNNNPAATGDGPAEVRIHRATEPGIPTAFEAIDSATILADEWGGGIPFADAAIDGQDRLHVIWVDRSAPGQALRYRVFDTRGLAWQAQAETIDETGLSGFGGEPGQGGVSIALDFDGHPRVAYTVAGYQTHIRVRTRGEAGWSAPSDPVVVEGAYVWHPTLALAPNGDWYLSAYDASNNRILASHDDGGGWSPVAIVATDVSGPESIDQGPALLVTPAGMPVLTYIDSGVFIRVSAFNGSTWVDLPFGGDYDTHAQGLGIFADGTLVIAGHDEARPPNAINQLQGLPPDWSAWTPLVAVHADGSEVFRWAGAFSQPGATVTDLLFFDEDTNDDDIFNDQTLYYVAVPLLSNSP
jgi:hypothetical protein